MAKILTIDDEPVIRKTFVAYLEDSDFQVIEAASGYEGVELCRRDPPDLVLCDLMMPEMNGLSVLEILHREFPELPIIVVSGIGRLNDAVEALKNGAWDYISKPVVDMTILEHAINHALERAQLLRKNRQYYEDLVATNKRLEQSLQQLRDDEEAGRHLQFQLLPPMRKRFGNYRFSRRLVTSLYLSGDFVDYFPIDHHRLGFYIADVSGHGVPSAFITVLLKSYMSRYLDLYRQGKNRGILHPAKILTRLNHNVLSSGMEKYLTMFYCVLDIEQNRLFFSNGGQFPMPFLSVGGEVRSIGEKSLPVGLFDFAEYRTETLDLPDRFSLAMISDGILELLPQSNLQDKLLFMQTVLRDTRDIDVLVRRLGVEDVDVLPDDVTVLLIEREPS